MEICGKANREKCLPGFGQAQEKPPCQNQKERVPAPWEAVYSSLMALGEKLPFADRLKEKVLPAGARQRGNESVCMRRIQDKQRLTCKESHGDILLYAAVRCRRGKSQKGFKAAFEKNHQLQAAGVPRISSCISQKERRRGKNCLRIFIHGVFPPLFCPGSAAPTPPISWPRPTGSSLPAGTSAPASGSAAH